MSDHPRRERCDRTATPAHTPPAPIGSYSQRSPSHFASPRGVCSCATHRHRSAEDPWSKRDRTDRSFRPPTTASTLPPMPTARSGPGGHSADLANRELIGHSERRRDGEHVARFGLVSTSPTRCQGTRRCVDTGGSRPKVGPHGVVGGPQFGLSSVPSVTCTGLLPSALTIHRVSLEPSGSDRAKTIFSPSGDQSGE
jgi:hypothetical protein